MIMNNPFVSINNNIISRSPVCKGHIFYVLVLRNFQKKKYIMANILFSSRVFVNLAAKL